MFVRRMIGLSFVLGLGAPLGFPVVRADPAFPSKRAVRPRAPVSRQGVQPHSLRDLQTKRAADRTVKPAHYVNLADESDPAIQTPEQDKGFGVPEDSVAAPVTATIYNAWWLYETDSNTDDCVEGWARLRWDPDVVGSPGSLDVNERVYFRLSGAGPWIQYSTTTTHTITGTATTDEQYVDIPMTGNCTPYDYRIDVYRLGENLPDDTRDPTNDAELYLHNEENAPDGVAATVYDAWWANETDVDNNACISGTARLVWDADVVGSNGPLWVFEKIYFWDNVSAQGFTLYATTGMHLITGSAIDDVRFFDIGMGPGACPTRYNYTVEVFRFGQTTPDYTRDAINDADLNDHLEESPPSPPVISSFTIQPNHVTGGDIFTVAVTLSSAAPPEGMLIEFDTDGSDATLIPPMVTVAPDETSATFTFVTQRVQHSTLIGLSARSNGTIATADLQVDAPEITRLSLTPDIATGGETVEAMITLNALAPFVGLTFDLASSDPVAAQVPPTVVVKGGETEARFTILTSTSSAQTSIDITATRGGLGRQATLTVTPPELIHLTVTPPVLVGGRPAKGKVSLYGTAPLGGTIIELASSDTSLAIVPEDVTIPAGQNSATFAIPTFRQATLGTVHVSATLADKLMAEDLTVLAADKGDADGDADVDDFDYARFQKCLSGPDVGATAQCSVLFGVDNDGDVDLVDVAGFQQSFTGRGIGLPRPTFDVDSNVVPVAASLSGFDAATPRPLAAIVDSYGIQAEFVENELVLVTDDLLSVDQFVARWDGQVLMAYSPRDYNFSGERQHLIRIRNALADTTHLQRDLLRLEPLAHGANRVSSEAGLQLLSAAASEAGQGSMIGINWVARSASFRSRVSTEDPNGASIAPLSGYSRNAFDWSYLNEGSIQDIGVTEAWRVLDRLARFGNKVRIAVMDGGFSANRDFPGSRSSVSYIPLVADFEVEGFGLRNNMANGPSEPWHATDVVGAAMGVPDNGYGAAGPAGPVAHLIMAAVLGDMFTSTHAVLNLAAIQRADIINMSFTVPVTWWLSWSILPFDAATLAVGTAGNVLLFAAAGNAGEDVDREDCIDPCSIIPFVPDCPICWEPHWYYPCENGGVICVGGIAENSKMRDGGSNWGGENVDIFAPYVVLVGETPRTSGANRVTGSSLSSPYAAGVAALIWAADPNLSARSVEILMNRWAHTSPDPTVKHYVDAYESVVAASGGNSPPEVKILSPLDGGTYSLGAGLIGFYFDAVATDREDGPLPVTWTSDLDGVVTSPAGLRFGRHVLRAAATDSGGLTDSVAITITVESRRPQVKIITPRDGEHFYVEEPIGFLGTSYDIDSPGFRLSNVIWRSNPSGLVILGHAYTQALFTEGTYVITFRGTDSGGLSDEKSVRIHIDPRPAGDLPPTASIFTPSGEMNYLRSIEYTPEGVPTGREYADVLLEGRVVDREDRVLNGTWITNRDDLQQPCEGFCIILGSGPSIMARLYRTPCAVDLSDQYHEITLIGLDSAGQPAQGDNVRRIGITCLH